MLRVTFILSMTLALAAFGLAGVFGSGVAVADGGKGVAVKPLTPKPGDTITVKGDLLGPNSKVEVRMVGMNTDVDLGEVTADAEGDFSAEFVVPVGLAPGMYQVQANGAETASTQITVLASGAKGEATPKEGQTASEMAAATTPVRERPAAETIGLVALFVVLFGLGLYLARGAHQAPAR